MIDIGSLIYNIKYGREGVILVDPSTYIKKIAVSRDTENSSGLEYACAQFNRANDYNEEAQKLLAMYH